MVKIRGRIINPNDVFIWNTSDGFRWHPIPGGVSRTVKTDDCLATMIENENDMEPNTLSTSTKDNMLAVPELRMADGCLVDNDGKRYRIRKLTPTECFRLMDVDDSDIEKMKQAGIAKTNLYKLAGNSICVACMFHLFRKLFIEKQNENQQLELF